MSKIIYYETVQVSRNDITIGQLGLKPQWAFSLKPLGYIIVASGTVLKTTTGIFPPNHQATREVADIRAYSTKPQRANRLKPLISHPPCLSRDWASSKKPHWAFLIKPRY